MDVLVILIIKEAVKKNYNIQVRPVNCIRTDSFFTNLTLDNNIHLKICTASMPSLAAKKKIPKYLEI